MASLGDALGAFDLVSVGRDDGVTAAALVALAPFLSAERVRMIESRVRTASIESIAEDIGIGSIIYSGESAQSYLFARLAPSLARAGEVARSLAYAHSAPEEHASQPFSGSPKRRPPTLARRRSSGRCTQPSIFARPTDAISLTP
jgi:hypothetical protein